MATITMNQNTFTITSDNGVQHNYTRKELLNTFMMDINENMELYMFSTDHTIEVVIHRGDPILRELFF